LKYPSVCSACLECRTYPTAGRRRNALTMRPAWPTFPMVLVDGTLIGGAADFDVPIAHDELTRSLTG
jgi:glutaredoxin-related protein